MKLTHKVLASIMMLSMSTLAACSATQQSQGVAAFEAAYIIDANVLAQYKNGSLGIKPAADVVSKIDLYNDLAKERLDVVRTAARTGKGISAIEQLAAQDAINALTSLLSSYGLLNNQNVKFIGK